MLKWVICSFISRKECVCSLFAPCVCAMKNIAGISSVNVQYNRALYSSFVLNAHFSIVFIPVGNFRRCFTVLLDDDGLFYVPSSVSLWAILFCVWCANAPKASSQLNEKASTRLQWYITHFYGCHKCDYQEHLACLSCIICVLSFRFEWSR